MKKEISYLELVLAIDEIKKKFESELSKRLCLTKVQSPLFVKVDSGLQDCLSGTEKAIGFVKDGESYEIVHSLAKWKRDALGRYGFKVHTGLLTDMKAIRRDEIVDDIHSMYVEQWDWEKVITHEDRCISYLKQTVRSIYSSLKATLKYMKKYSFITLELPKKVKFITSQELEDMYPEHTPKEREELITESYGAVFIIGIGDKLKSGSPHDLRSPDYDDWSLDGDLLIYDPALKKAIEITSMGIRVDEISIMSQLEKAHALDRVKLPYHQKIIKKELPYTIGGGIGISRILMLILGSSHIAEVQASHWDTKTTKLLKEKKVL